MTDVSLGAATVNLNGIVENDNWSIALTLTAGTGPYDLTGATITAGIKTDEGLSALTTTVTDPAAGKLTVSQTGAPLFSIATWALRINHRTIMGGTVSGRPDILT